MKKLSILLLLLFLLFFHSSPVGAQTTNITPNPAPTPEEPKELKDPPANSVDGIVNTFISSFDWISSGLIFNTPNLLQETITLGDETKITGISQYRNIFADIAIPIFVIITSFIALSHITHDNSYQLKSFIKRILVVIVLMILTPYILTYSIEFINLLNNKINAQNTLDLVNFITDYTKTGDLAKLFSFSMNPIEFFSKFPSIMMQLIVMIISIGFLLIGFLYIIFQAVIRFISLLFLSVIYPIVIPFALSEKTEEIVNTFFRTWCTLLIQQPAFILGFAIVSAIFTSILKAHGGNIGILFLYSGALFFLGGVNVFIGRIFGDGWSLLATNAQSMLASGAIRGSGFKTINEIKKGAITGRASGIRSYAGAYLGNKMRLMVGQSKQENTKGGESHKPPPLKYGNKTPLNNLPLFSKEAIGYGVQAKSVNNKNGVVKLQGSGYSYTDPDSNLTTTYLSKSDAISAGHKDNELKPTQINHLVVDHSNFNKENPIPYGTDAIRKSNKGSGIRSYLGHTNENAKIKEYLEAAKDDFRQAGTTGLLMKQYDPKGKTKTNKKTLRIYSDKPL